ncbi:MAG: hypothetical protein IKG89_00450 [Oscillospiraceae bacterium]|nr:hypothetical protein [Oscillospiraceae bacterium]
MDIVLTDHSEQVSCGKLYTFQIAMKPIPDGRIRTIRVWLPEIYDGVRRFPVLYMHDGQYVFPENGPLEGMGSWQFARKISELEPECQCIVVAIDTSGDRGSELLPPYKRNPAHRIPRDPGTPDYVALGHLYADFVRDTLKPVIDERFLTLPDAAHTGIGGSSMGGLQSYYMTMRDPNVFGRSLDLSAGLDILDESCLELIDGYDPKRLENARFYFYSGDQGMDVTIMKATVTVYRRMKDMLHLTNRQICMMIDSRESHWGTSWGKYLQDGLRYLFSEDNGVESPPGFTQNLPRDKEHSS